MSPRDNPQLSSSFLEEEKLQIPDRHVRGWDKLAASYGKRKTTVREWIEKGCPYQLDGRAHIFDLDKVDEWLEARGEFGEEDAEGGRSTIDKVKLRKLELEADKLQRDKDLAEGLTAHRDEFFEVYKRNMRKIVISLDAHMKRVKKQIPNLTAEKAESLDAMVIDVLNEIAELPTE